MTMVDQPNKWAFSHCGPASVAIGELFFEGLITRMRAKLLLA